MRSNYASVDCAASIVYSNNAQNPANILKPDRDSYLLYECSAPEKTVHIQLCQDILVDSILVGNFELFSSSFRHIKVYGTDRYAYESTNWNLLGSFTGADERLEQLFTIENPHVWASHLRIDFLSYWGDEFYCPINTFAVYGTTMLDQSKTILTPHDSEDIKECFAPDKKEDPCAVSQSPLEPQQCCQPRENHSGSSFYEVILNRIQQLELQNSKTNAFINSMNSTFIRQTHQLQVTLQQTLDQVHYQHQTIALQTLLLIIVIGYGMIQALARNKLHESDTDILPFRSATFGLDERRPESPLLFSTVGSTAGSPPGSALVSTAASATASATASAAASAVGSVAGSAAGSGAASPIPSPIKTRLPQSPPDSDSEQVVDETITQAAVHLLTPKID